MRTYLDTQTSIVLKGRFNPAIFQPQWFAKHNLLKEAEAEAAEIEIIHRDATIFSTEKMRLQVNPDSFVLFSKQSGYDEELRDLITGTFTVLTHSPIKYFGVNWEGEFKVDSEEVWHEIGHRLAPKEGIWDDILSTPGTSNVTIKGQRDDEFKGVINVRIGPERNSKNHPGIYIHINDHFILGEGDDEENAELFTKTLILAWDGILTRRETISEKLKTL